LNWNLGYEGARTHAATQSVCVQGGERNGWGLSTGVSLAVVLRDGCRRRRKSLWRSGGGGRYEAADQGSASFRNIQAASFPRWGLSEVLASRPYGRGSMRRGAGSGDRPLILFEGMAFVLFEGVTFAVLTAGAPRRTKSRSTGPVDCLVLWGAAKSFA
jgi:hypothetical protein